MLIENSLNDQVWERNITLTIEKASERELREICSTLLSGYMGEKRAKDALILRCLELENTCHMNGL
jgi:hypothetical protein